jgi:3D (Asp-Asp-Asp) domain-containing protein
MADAFPLIGRNGDPISPPLTQRDWCESALQGSVSVRTGETATAYVYVDDKGPEQANCDQWLGSLSDGVKNATRRARFMKVNHALGCGSRNHPLVPFRTIAVDPAKIPIESVVYVPELRGRAFRHTGREYVHDGYLFAGDRGGAIKGALESVSVRCGALSRYEFSPSCESNVGRRSEAEIVLLGPWLTSRISPSSAPPLCDMTLRSPPPKTRPARPPCSRKRSWRRRSPS